MKPTLTHQKSVLLFFLFTLLLGCSNDDGTISYDFVGSWKVSYYMEGSQKVTKEDSPTWPDYNNGDITATFTAPDGNGKGVVSGISVTNAYHGDYTLERNGTLTIDPIATTLVNQPDWADLYHITGPKTYKIKGSNLFLYSKDEDLVIVMESN
ncbi:META domain-containing protein [Muricauda oceani]|uniref:META domain-containing protein n=1 Tax=Flagellimonas oceani TaxID=2698672 RepID=A0A6G7IZW8_9FLAO|nr:hypothetical protein [Allomuricauda oceani]MBW8244254.1 META domain-containing protein [Allomuricauda oceani]QII44096.1 hypothetical protein GVT53_05225 [Allomuricauda oceani]